MHPIYRSLALLAGLVAFPTAAQTTYTWIGSHADNTCEDAAFWDCPASWSPEGVPGVGDHVVITGASVFLNQSRTVATLTLSGTALLCADVGAPCAPTDTRTLTVTDTLARPSGGEVWFGAGVRLVTAEPMAADSVAGPDWAALRAENEVPRVRSSFSPKNRYDATLRGLYEQQRLQDPRTGLIPEGIRARELAFAEQVASREELGARVQPLFADDWTLRGPLNVGGRTRGLAIDLGYNGTTNRRILAGGISGGMFLSEDGGATWRLTSSLAQFASVTALAQDPTNRQVWYHGTGEFLGNSASGNHTASYGREGIFKSTDGGLTWAQLPATAQGAYTSFDDFFDVVWNLAVHPQTGTVLAATYAGVFRSTDGGASWQLVLGRSQSPFSAFTDVAVAADGSVYAALSRNGGGFAEYGVYRSTNDGATWTRISPAALAADPYRMVLGTAPSDANTVYLFAQTTQEGDDPLDHQLFRYNAGTNTWTDRSASLQDESGFGGEFTTQGGYDMLVAVKPNDPNAVWVGGTNLYRSTNGGQSFQRVAGYDGQSSTGRWANHHPDQHRVVFYPNDPNAMISGHDGGLSVTTNVLQQPQAWTSLNNGYLTSQFYALAVDPQPGSPLIAGGLQDNGTWLTESASGSQPWQEVFTGDGGYTAFAPGGFPLYVSSQLGNVVRLTQTSLSRVAPAGAQNFLFIAPYLLDPNDARVMYLAAGNAVWRNSNLDGIPVNNTQPTATNWTQLTTSAVGTVNTHQVTALAVSTTPANRLYFGATNHQNETVLKRVDNPAANPAGTTITPPGLTGGAYPSSIAVNPANADEIVATFSNYNVVSVWHSANGGTSWTAVEGNLGGADGPSVRWAAIVPVSGGTVYLLATSTGVYSTQALSGAGTVWIQEAASTIGNVVVDMIATRPQDGLVVAGTHGRGVYSATLGQSSGSAVASTDVQRLDIAVRPGEVGTASFTLRNTGAAPLSFSITAREGSARTGVRTDDRLHVEGLRPTWTVANDAALRRAGIPAAQEPATRTRPPDGVLFLDDGNETPDDFVGTGDPFSLFGVSNTFDLSSAYQLERIRFYMRTEGSSSNSVVFQVRDENGAMIADGTVGLPLSPNGQWYDIVLGTPISFNAGDSFFLDVFFFGFIAFPAGVDVDATVPGKSYYYDANSGQWVHLVNVQGFQDAAFLVRAVGTGGAGNQPPVARGSISPGNPAAGETVTFDASTSSDPDGLIAAYLWAFGDGATSSQAIATHAYSTAGTYTVSLTVTDGGGATDQISAQITVTGGGGTNQPPTAVAQASDGTPDVGQTVTFDGSQSTDADGQIVAYLWAFGDGATSSQAVATHAYSTAGTYTATLTVTDDGGATGQASGTLTVTGTPGPARFAVSPTQGTVAPGGSQAVTVTFDTQGLTEATYPGTVSITGNGGSLSLPVSVTVDQTVAVDETPGEGGARLAQNYPNPFNEGTVIRYELDVAAEVALHVFDVTGRQIRVLDAGLRAPGPYEVRWDGRDAVGDRVASGLYLYRLEATGAAGPPARLMNTMIVLH